MNGMPVSEIVWLPLLGGAMIGLAAGLLMLGLGRIAGISGILAGALGFGSGTAWRLAFVLGLSLGALAVIGLLGFEAPTVRASPLVVVTGGFLVGFGTRLGSGCTSGHGVCGVARGSRRSLVATATFMLVAAATVYVVRHVL